MLQERPHFYDRHIAMLPELTVSKILNRNGLGEANKTKQGRRVFLFY
jgi:hypothetical protein